MSDKGLASLDVLDPVTRRHVERAADALQNEFAGIFAQETIARFIAESTDLLSGGSINVFVPVLAHRFARERLKALGQAEGVIAKEQPEVLFVCVHNSGRSQMAAGLVKLRSEGRIHVRSAGSDPGEQINPAVIEAMTELGVDMSEEFPKPLTDEVVRAADMVITMGCGDACPIYPGKKYEDWVLDDPAGQEIETVRRIRDELDTRVADADRRATPLRQLTLPLARALVAETIGTFALVFAGCGAIMVDEKTSALGHVGVAITFGLVIMVMIYAVGHVSGAHFNPAVTFSFALARHFPRRHVPLYWGAQLAGALIAAAILRGSLGNIAHVGATFPSGSDGTGLPLGSDPLVLPDVRDHGRRDRHAGSRRGRCDRDRRHRRSGRHVRRPDHRRVDEPRSFTRPRNHRRRSARNLGLPARPDPRSGHRGSRLRVRPRALASPKRPVT